MNSKKVLTKPNKTQAIKDYNKGVCNTRQKCSSIQRYVKNNLSLLNSCHIEVCVKCLILINFVTTVAQITSKVKRVKLIHDQGSTFIIKITTYVFLRF